MRQKQLGFTLFELFIAIAGVGVLAGFCAIVWVTAHFIVKFW